MDLALLMFGVFLLLALLRVPVAVALGVASLIGMMWTGLSFTNFASQLVRGLDIYTILAIPFFLATGYLAGQTSFGFRLLELSEVVLRRLPGRVGHMNVVGSMMFAGVSGSSSADTAGVGSVMIPMMRRQGYSREYAAALTAVTSTLGNIIPPSIFAVLYSAFAGVSVGALFLAGVVPGFLLGLSFMVVNHVVVTREKIDGGGGRRHSPVPVANVAAVPPNIPHDSSLPQRSQLTNDVLSEDESKVVQGPRVFRAIWGALPALAVPFIILGGITSGAFTATEAGVVALLYTLIVLLVIYRDTKPRQLLTLVRESVEFYPLPILAAGVATVFGTVLAVAGLAADLRLAVEELSVGPQLYLLCVIVVFMVVGMFLDGFPAIVVFVPIFLDGASAAGVHDVHLGAVVILTLALGLCTPPYGMSLMIAARLAGAPAAAVIRSMLPFYCVALLVITMVTLLPDLVLWLPRLLIPTVE